MRWFCVSAAVVAGMVVLADPATAACDHSFRYKQGNVIWLVADSGNAQQAALAGKNANTLMGIIRDGGIAWNGPGCNTTHLDENGHSTGVRRFGVVSDVNYPTPGGVTVLYVRLTYVNPSTPVANLDRCGLSTLTSPQHGTIDIPSTGRIDVNGTEKKMDCWSTGALRYIARHELGHQLGLDQEDSTCTYSGVMGPMPVTVSGAWAYYAGSSDPSISSDSCEIAQEQSRTDAEAKMAEEVNNTPNTETPPHHAGDHTNETVYRETFNQQIQEWELICTTVTVTTSYGTVSEKVCYLDPV